MASLRSILKGTRGLNTTYDPVRIGSASLIPYLAEAVNVDIDESGRITRCKGFTPTERTEASHSIFEGGGVCLYVSGSCLYRLNSDYSRTELRNDLTLNAQMSYVTVADTIFYSNDYQTGKYENSTNVAWAAGAHVGVDTDREFTAPRAGKHHCLYRGRIYYAIGSILYHTEPGAYSWVDEAEDFIPLEGAIRMVKSVNNGIFVGTERGTIFLQGEGPAENFLVVPVDNDKVLEYSAVQIDGSEFNLTGNHVIWASSRGILRGNSDGQVQIITEDRLSFPSIDIGYGFYANGRYILNIARGYTSYLTIRANLKYQFNDRTGRTGALSQQTRLTFNSACMFNGVSLAAGSTGISILDSGSLYGSTPISAHIKTHTDDFGTYRNKHIRKMIISGEGSGEMLLTTNNKDGNARDYPFSFTAGNNQESIRVPVGRDAVASHWNFKIANVGGSDFSIDEISALEITN